MKKYNKQEQFKYTSYSEKSNDTSKRDQWTNTTSRTNAKTLITGNNRKI